MPVKTWSVISAFICFLTPVAVKAFCPEPNAVKIQHVQRDTMMKQMTPVRLLDSENDSTILLVFLESPRFFSLALPKGKKAQAVRQKWISRIAAKKKLKVFFRENPAGDAVILEVSE